ncbi:hypothetical protein vseg_015973 [Gypsophila vaccaria]
MARKSSLQRHRKLSLRGRSVIRSNDSPEKNEKESNATVEVIGAQAGPDGDTSLKSKNINEILGIPELEIDDEEEGEVVADSPIEKQAEKQRMSIDSVLNVTTEDDDIENEDVLQIQPEDVEDEVEYWSQAVVCYILGANPPWEVIEGLIRRIWSRYNIDKISFMLEGIFLVRFKTKEMQETVLQSGYYLFDTKPLIFKAWTKDTELKKTDVTVVPAWIQFDNLPLKFWGRSLPKITGLVGKFIKKDTAIEERTKLGYARVMVELKVRQQFPEQVKFKDETGDMVRVGVEYEWKPVICHHCNGMGHIQENCRKKDIKQPPQKMKKSGGL